MNDTVISPTAVRHVTILHDVYSEPVRAIQMSNANGAEFPAVLNTARWHWLQECAYLMLCFKTFTQQMFYGRPNQPNLRRLHRTDPPRVHCVKTQSSERSFTTINARKVGSDAVHGGFQ